MDTPSKGHYDTSMSHSLKSGKIAQPLFGVSLHCDNILLAPMTYPMATKKNMIVATKKMMDIEQPMIVIIVRA